MKAIIILLLAFSFTHIVKANEKKCVKSFDKKKICLNIEKSYFDAIEDEIIKVKYLFRYPLKKVNAKVVLVKAGQSLDDATPYAIKKIENSRGVFEFDITNLLRSMPEEDELLDIYISTSKKVSKKELKVQIKVGPRSSTIKHRYERDHCGAWLPKMGHPSMQIYLSALAKYAKKNQDGPLIEPIASLKSIVLSNEILNDSVQKMFINAYKYWKLTPTPLSTFKNMPATFDIFLQMLNGIMKTAPAFYTVSDTDLKASGLVAFPINAILDFPMATPQGYAVFSNSLINQQLKKILSHWSTFLVSPDSTYVFYSKTHNLLDAPLIPWFSPDGKKQMLDVAFQYTGNNAPSGIEFCDIYVCPNPTNKKTYGFPHWDAFFIKNFAPDIRPLGGPLNPTRWNPSSDDVILNACESAPLSEPVEDVQMSNRFWYKEQWYSLSNILDADDKRAKSFAGGTVYQAFLSGLSYHRWHSPVRGIVTKTKIVSGSYYLGNKYEGFYPDSSMPPDFEGPNLSQKFISAVATRAIMYIQGPAPVGLMAFVAIGMAEVSSCEFFVKEGDTIQKGQEIGAFHYGGSTHLLIFQRNVKLQWVDFNKMYHTGEPGLNSTNVPVNASIAQVKV